jgi:Na+/melibiose symporter-like transporter
LTYYFQSVLGYGPLKTGLVFLPPAFAIILGAQISSRLIAKVGIRPLLQIGATLAALGFFWLSLIKSDSNYWIHVFTPSLITPFAMGMLFPPLAMAATSGVDRADAGLASGVLNTARQVGGSLALAGLATVATNRTHSLIHVVSAHAALTAGYQRAFQISALMALVALAVAFLLPRMTGQAPPVRGIDSADVHPG